MGIGFLSAARFVLAAALVALLPEPSFAEDWSAERTKLVAAAEKEGEISMFSQPNLAALDAAITRIYANIRRTADTPSRNRTILNNVGLSSMHGSFTGW